MEYNINHAPPPEEVKNDEFIDRLLNSPYKQIMGGKLYLLRNWVIKETSDVILDKIQVIEPLNEHLNATGDAFLQSLLLFQGRLSVIYNMWFCV